MQQDFLHRYPKGPKLTAWLHGAVSEQSDLLEDVSSADKARFSEQVRELFAQLQAPVKEEDFIDLADELVAMDLPILALSLFDAYPETTRTCLSFRRFHVESTASLLSGEFSRAEQSLCAAQAAIPEEPAPYVNLAQLYEHQGEPKKALEWCELGMQTCPNHLPLWEVFARMHSQEDTDQLFSIILQQAKRYGSWAGHSLAAELDPDKTQQSLVYYLDPFYKQGEREEAFLAEYTGALGAAGDFDRVLKVIALELSGNRELDWPLHMHSLQASFALGHQEEFALKAQLIRRRFSERVPQEILQEIDHMAVDKEHWGA